MTAPADIAAYREQHTVAQTMAHFGIGEGAVYKACRKARRNAIGKATQIDVAPQNVPAAPTPPVAAPVPSEDVAGDDCDWVCPFTNQAFPDIPAPVPGTTREMWHAQRRVAYLYQHAPPPAPPKVQLRQVHPAPPVPAPRESEALPQSAPAPSLIERRPAPSLIERRPAPAVHLHRTAYLMSNTQHPTTNTQRPLAMQGYDWIQPEGQNWYTVVAWLAVAILIAACAL